MKRLTGLPIISQKSFTVIGLLALLSLLWNCSCDHDAPNTGPDTTEDSSNADGGKEDNSAYRDSAEDAADPDRSQQDEPSAGRGGRPDVQNAAGSESSGGINGATPNGTGGDVGFNSGESGGTDSSDSDHERLDIPYENLQSLPDTTARLCPNANYSPGQSDIFTSCDDICPNAHCVPTLQLLNRLAGPP